MRTTPNGTRTRTRTRAPARASGNGPIAKRRKWERVPQQYPVGPPALAGRRHGLFPVSRERASLPMDA
jgi:hypothetical protein